MAVVVVFVVVVAVVIVAPAGTARWCRRIPIAAALEDMPPHARSFPCSTAMSCYYQLVLLLAPLGLLRETCATVVVLAACLAIGTT